MSRTIRRPSPSMIVAGAALVVALAGTAVAGPLATKSVLNKPEKKQVRNIAKNQVTSLASGLSVANATNATNASNAGTVDGANASDLRTSSAFDEDSSNIALGTGFVSVASATITTQSTGRILATASAELSGASGSEEGSCQILIDGAGSPNYDSSPDGDKLVIAVNFAVTRPAGTYEARLECGTNGTMNKVDAGINVYGLGA